MLNVSDISNALKDRWEKVRPFRGFNMQSLVSEPCEPVTQRHKTPSIFDSLGRQLGALLSLVTDENRSFYVLTGIIVFSLLLATGAALTRRPWCDEAWFASPSYNLAHHGFMGMTILDPHGFIHTPYVQGVDRYTFWVMPGYLLLQAAWYKLVGLSVFSMRATSICGGW